MKPKGSHILHSGFPSYLATPGGGGSIMGGWKDHKEDWQYENIFTNSNCDLGGLPRKSVSKEVGVWPLLFQARERERSRMVVVTASLPITEQISSLDTRKSTKRDKLLRGHGFQYPFHAQGALLHKGTLDRSRSKMKVRLKTFTALFGKESNASLRSTRSSSIFWDLEPLSDC